ncbi:MAG: zinc-binding dehydrogenase [Phycisphaerae bacterium]
MPTVLAAVMPRPGARVELRELPQPQLEPGSALLEVELSEVCGTDVHLRDGRLAGVPYPIIPGHVAVGRLAKVRGTLLDVNGRPLAEGDRVTFLDVHRTCNACYFCLVAKATTRCPKRKVYGITYGLEDGLTGGWATRLYLKPGTRCIRLDGVDPARFMAGGCALPTSLHAVERAEVSIGDTVLVLGSGPVGLSCVIFARMRGAIRVLCIGAPRSRLETAHAVGADATFNFQLQSNPSRGLQPALPIAAADDEGHAQPAPQADNTDASLEWVLQQTAGRGPDVTIEATGAPAAVVQAMRFTRDAGRVVVVGQYTDHGDVTFNPHLDLNKKHLDVRGCWGSDFSHFYRGVRIMTDARLSKPWTSFKLKRYPLAAANEAITAVAGGDVLKALIDPKA